MYFKQIDEIVSGAKTQTRRVVKSNELGNENLVDRGTYSAVHSTHDNESRLRLKWEVGRDYAVSPGRGKPGVWWNSVTGDYRWPAPMGSGGMPEENWDALRIRLLEIRREPLKDITEADAKTEGYPHTMPQKGITILSPVRWYSELWTVINGKGSWGANPDVWVLTFEVVR